ncbi:hypothetical protein U8527_08920 [Kordia algicida OT-1]|uniref:Uncharacterized protein n=1 Tax=Kordia algicida OT-1 TaxID=391587 RepID=A9DTQ1_9FLAO|nr:hypothetical protein [Kordia algicida]EDP96220.1 hypothetical protein KAOT1_02387 [Kordia algicida OT-1]
MKHAHNSTATVQNGSSFIIIKDRIPKKTLRPYILSEDRLQMLKRYRSFVNSYNDSVKELNKEVSVYNKSVQEFIATYNLKQQAVTAQFNFENRQQQNSKVKWLSIKDYNSLVASTNGNMLLLPKRKYSKIKAMHERTFEVILWLYGNQLSELRKHLTALDTNLAVSFPKVKITATAIAHLTNDGERRILYSSRTVQNHIYRLRDAGIITDYSFHGTKKPVHFFINEAIFQMHDKSLTSDDNQTVTDFLTKKVRDKSEDTRTFTKEIIKKVGNVDNHSQNSEVFSFATENSSKNKNPHKIPKKDDRIKFSNENAGKLGGEIFPKNCLSEYLRSQIQYRSELFQALTANHYDTYSFSASNMNKRLEVEAIKGAMSREEYRELLLQLFLKMAAPIWKDMNVYYGSWHNAYIHIDDEYLRNPNGSIPRKETLLYMFGFLVYRINRAKRFFNSKKVYRIHYPCIYFDPTRKKASEGGFAYTLQWLKQYQKYKDLRATRKQQRATKAGARRKQKTNEEKVRDKIKQYIKDEITLPQIYTYIETNKGIPNYFVSEVPRFIEIETNKEFDLYE